MTGRGPVTWSGRVAGIVMRSGETCHRDEGAAPFSLATYEEASGWAELMAEVAASGRMPPWNLHPRYEGLFRNERLLTDEEVEDLLGPAVQQVLAA